MTTEEDDKGLEVVTRWGKVEIGDFQGNEEAQTHEEEKGMEGEKSTYPSNHCFRIKKRNGESQYNRKSYATFTEIISPISPKNKEE